MGTQTREKEWPDYWFFGTERRLAHSSLQVLALIQVECMGELVELNDALCLTSTLLARA